LVWKGAELAIMSAAALFFTLWVVKVLAPLAGQAGASPLLLAVKPLLIIEAVVFASGLVMVVIGLKRAS
jgi:hypothetical protein